ncbi:hypothetical protein JTE90_029154 [Oedothorax gibbosus]|uniref:Uncharacterized protein n=1 Tax=Oedothorax gibbosus TaxID=931172 RepID=A0AAV6THH6_9ARAC|nr:hypothetical protein JTE90_029154 [Oedothorax gibbosus]
MGLICLRRNPDLTSICRQNPYGASPGFLWPLLSGDSSPSFGSQRVRSNSPTSQNGTGGPPGGPPAPEGKGIRMRPTPRRPVFHFAPGVIQDPLLAPFDSLVRVSRRGGPGQGTCCRVRLGTLTPNAHISPRPLRAVDSALGFSLFTRRY